MTLYSPPRSPFRLSPGIWLATLLISGYQRFISPRKGFRCAHRVLHGSRSCSGYAKFVIQQRGLVGAVPLIRQRFSDCSLAAIELQHASGNADPVGRSKRQAIADCCSPSPFDCCTYGDCGVMEGCDAECDALSCGDGAADCGGADCAGADCVGADCCGF